MTEEITAGRGWIAIAIVVFSRWNPYWALGGSILFGATTAIQLRLQALGAWSRTLEEFDGFFRELKNRIGGQVHGVILAFMVLTR